jgi:hypothetical protein
MNSLELIDMSFESSLNFSDTKGYEECRLPLDDRS